MHAVHVRSWVFCLLVGGPGLGMRAASAGAPADSVRWVLADTKSIGGHVPLVLGAPEPDGDAPALRFDGVDDGLILPVNPIGGWRKFSIEALFRPDPSGREAQRFLHIQEVDDHRCLLEIRLNEDGRWSLDAYLRWRGKGRALLDRTKVHPAGEWTWVAVVYDGAKATTFVNGVKELDAEIAFAPMRGGRTSLGVRLNEVSWFKGTIGEVRFHPRALDPTDLQRVP